MLLLCLEHLQFLYVLDLVLLEHFAFLFPCLDLRSEFFQAGGRDLAASLCRHHGCATRLQDHILVLQLLDLVRVELDFVVLVSNFSADLYDLGLEGSESLILLLDLAFELKHP